MKKLSFILFLMFLIKTSLAQDIIYKKNGEIKTVYRLKEQATVVTYTLDSTLTFPVYTLRKSLITSIKYKSGNTTNFSTEKSKSENRIYKKDSVKELLVPMKSYSISFDLSHLQSGPYTIGLDYKINKYTNLRIPFSLGARLFHGSTSNFLYGIGGDLQFYFAQSKHLGLFIGPSLKYGIYHEDVILKNAEIEYQEFTYTTGLISTGLKLAFNKKIALSFIGSIEVLSIGNRNIKDGKNQINLHYTF